MVAVIVHLPRRRLGQSWSVVLNWRNLARGYKLVACARDWPQPVGQLTHGPFKPISSATAYLASLISVPGPCAFLASGDRKTPSS